ncbi:MAG: hypothetical protein ACK401_01595, partial [Archaeoglobaceae archaeon]
EDPCMFFESTLNSTANLPKGTHQIKVSILCKPGDKEVKANEEIIAVVKVEKASEEFVANYTSNLERTVISLQNKLNKSLEELEKVREEIKKKEEAIKKLENEKGLLEIELTLTKDNLNNLQTRFDALSKDLETKKAKIREMEEEIKELSSQSQNFRVSTFFLVSIFIGSFAAVSMMTRRVK